MALSQGNVLKIKMQKKRDIYENGGLENFGVSTLIGILA